MTDCCWSTEPPFSPLWTMSTSGRKCVFRVKTVLLRLFWSRSLLSFQCHGIGERLKKNRWSSEKQFGSQFISTFFYQVSSFAVTRWNHQGTEIYRTTNSFSYSISLLFSSKEFPYWPGNLVSLFPAKPCIWTVSSGIKSRQNRVHHHK